MDKQIEKAAQAILCMAEGAQDLLAAESELEQVSAAVESNMELKRYLADISAAPQQKIALMFSILGKGASKSARAALCMIIAMDLQDHLREISQQFSAQVDQLKKQMSLEVVSAVALDRKTLAKIKKKVDKKTGLSVRIKHVVDPDIIGGLLVKVGDLRMDFSTRGKLETLKDDLKAVDLEGDFFGA